MDENADLRRALAFVIGRIEQEASRSGEPLNDEQRFLLHNLPTESTLLAINGTDPDSPPLLSPPRDLAYERLIALAREANRTDLLVSPRSGLEWKMAFIIAKADHHPMAWLLSWAGMKERRPWWDRLVLVAAALLFMAITVTLFLLIFAEVGSGGALRWIGVGTAYVAMLLLLWVASRYLEVWQLKRSLEKYRGTAVSGSN